jgi:hypothetical protein
MSKKRKDQSRYQPSTKNGSGSSGSKTAVVQPPERPPQEIISEAENAAQQDATQEDLEFLTSPTSSDAGADSLEQWAKRAAAAVAVLEEQRRRYEEKSRALTTREEAIERRSNELKIEAENQRQDRETFASEKEELVTRHKALNEREADVIAREFEAEEGFSSRFQHWLSGFDEQRTELQREIDDLRKETLRVRQESEAARHAAHEQLRSELEDLRRREAELLEKERERVEADLTSKRHALDDELRLFAEEKATIRSEQRKLIVEKELLAEDKQRLQAKVEAIAAARIEELDCQVFQRDEQLKAARADRERLAELLTLREQTDMRFGEKSPEEVLDSLETLKREREELRRRLSTMPSAQTTERLRDLEEEREQFQAERVALREDNRSLKARLTRAEIAVTEIESLRDQKAALETSRSLLEAALRELRTDVEERIKRSDGRCPFPSSAAMDNDEKLQTAPSTRQKIFDLPGFVDDVRHAIATGRATGKQLYYSERDLRCFLGGLAMSRLHLLQGISGTGKTSLPVAFAGAIGAGCKVIEIQAGWRDRQDLLGHYNAFERKFYESEFLLALYRAGCPRYEPLPFIIVLDEMNLSHPEQYFAEFISKLEQPSRARQIELTTEAVEPAPRLFQEGRILPLPRNVWFVGTANHDETTKDFAPKTYDRAHIMELPRHPGEFEIRPMRDQEPMALETLENVFDLAQKQYEALARSAYETITLAVGETLQRRFGVSWGNRLERQIQDYVPVVKAAGGSVGEGIDHIIATKLIRKIRGRHDNRPEYVRELRDQVESGLTAVDQNWFNSTDPSKMLSVAMLADEYETLGGESDD